MSVLPDAESKVFLRNAMKSNGSHARMIVAELDGVRAYILGTRVILTKRDLYL